MAINNHVRIPTIPSIYSDKKGLSRELDVYYSIPERGINEETGVLLYIYGFRGYAEANVFKKLRNNFADEHNLITIQCNYFGYEFMRKPKHLKPLDKHMEYFTKEELISIYQKGNFNADKFFELAGKYPVKMLIRENLSDECPENFNEMGIMQAVDNLNALIYVMNKISELGHNFNSKKVIFFGNSHGAYLSYLCNLIAPDLISLVIDNSAWLYPEHLAQDRRVMTETPGNATVKVVFDYKARDIIDDFDIIDLKKMYSTFENKATIISFHGEDDHLVSLKDKKKFLKGLTGQAYLHPITGKTLPNYPNVFSTTKHGLGANFINLFNYVVGHYDLKFEKQLEFNPPKNSYLETSNYRYIFDFSRDIPAIARCVK